MNKDRADILIEAIEVFINQILYLRDVYPQQIFKKRRIYNAPIYASVFPPLNSYLHNVLRSAKELLTIENNEHGDLRRLDLIFYIDEDTIIERHTFELFVLSGGDGTVDDDFLLDFEEELRKSLYQIPERMKLLEKLPNETKMNIHLHTTQSGHMQITNGAHFQDFPWLKNSKSHTETPTELKQWYLLPLVSVNKLGMNLMTEVALLK